ncbi:MAG: NADH-quinone oxidoreductase subunit NuoH [bacterium]
MMQIIMKLIQEYPLLWTFVKAVILGSFVLMCPLLLIWMERKVAGAIQSRVGPKHVGPHGLLQSVADALKLLMKESTVPTLADKRIYFIAPYVAYLSTLLTFMVLPFSPTWVALDMDVAVLFVIGVSLFNAVAIMMAGWASNNKFSLLGGLRAVAQLLAYEIPIALSVLCVVFYTGTMSLTEIVKQQHLHGWNVLQAPLAIASLIYFISSLAEVNRTPFDLPEAESELVSGFNTEYSGMRFGLFFVAEFANTFFVAAFAAALFFGGWSGPYLPPIVWFFLKVFVLVFIHMWVRWTPPRLRIDQLLKFAWQFMVPLSLLNLLFAIMMVALR